MVADINRLEQAARVSMSGFQDPEAAPSRNSAHVLFRIGVIAIVDGFVTLVAGMRADRSDDSDSDDGAVV